MTETIHVDFGKSERDREREFSRKLHILLGRSEDQKAEYLKDPSKFFEAVGSEIHKRDTVIRAAWEALQNPVKPFDPAKMFESLQTRVIDAEEYYRLKACEKIILKYGMP